MSFTDPSPTSSNFRVGAGVVILVVGIAAYLVLALFAPPEASDARGAVIILVTPLASGLIISGPLSTIVRNTNGKSEAERHEIATKAAQQAVRAVMADPNTVTINPPNVNVGSPEPSGEFVPD